MAKNGEKWRKMAMANSAFSFVKFAIFRQFLILEFHIEPTFRQPIILKLCRVTTGIDTEQTRPILNESEHVLEMANFSSMRGRVT